MTLEEIGTGYGLEIAMICKAHDMNILTMPCAFNSDEAVVMDDAGADVIVAHMSLTMKSSIGTSTAMTIDKHQRKCRKLPMRGNS